MAIETRLIPSVLEDGCSNKALLEADLIEKTAEVLAGTLLVLGQLVNIKTNIGATEVGSIAGVVTTKREEGLNKIEYYTITLLLGDLSATPKLTTIEVAGVDLLGYVSPVFANTLVIDAVVLGSLGLPTTSAMKNTLGIKHLFILDTAAENFASYL